MLAHARNLIEVVPAFEPNTSTGLTPRGYVGFFDGPTVRYVIGPKFPWPNIGMLLGMPVVCIGETQEPEGGLLAVMAAEFASQLDAVSRAGLVAGYGEASAVSPFLHGKLRTADQMRDAAATAFPDRFHIDEPVFDLHTPWHRIPKATAAALLRQRDFSRRCGNAWKPQSCRSRRGTGRTPRLTRTSMLRLAELRVV